MNERLDDWIYESQIEQWIEILNKYVGTAYTWYELSKFVKLTTIINNTNYPWDWNGISQNPDITWDRIIKNPDKPWNWVHIINNPNITWNIIVNTLDDPIISKKWCWYYIFCNSKITWDNIQYLINNRDKYDDIYISWYGIARNPNITWDIVKTHINYDWCWDELSFNDNFVGDVLKIGKSYIINNDLTRFNLPLDWYLVSKHPELTWDFIKDNIDKPWNWNALTQHKNITWDIIRDNPQYEWNDALVVLNPNITWTDIKENIGMWENHDVSLNPNITWDIVRDNPDYPWDYYFLTFNPNITLDNIFSIIDINLYKTEESKRKLKYKWYWGHIIRNKDLLWDHIRFIEEIDPNCISDDLIVHNPFSKQLDLIKQDCIIKWNMANRIRKWWLFKVYLNPFHPIGQKRLERSYLEMLEEDVS